MAIKFFRLLLLPFCIVSQSVYTMQILTLENHMKQAQEKKQTLRQQYHPFVISYIKENDEVRYELIGWTQYGAQDKVIISKADDSDKLSAYSGNVMRFPSFGLIEADVRPLLIHNLIYEYWLECEDLHKEQQSKQSK